MTPIEKARNAIGNPVKFNIKPTAGDEINCIEFLLDIFDLKDFPFPYPKIDSLIKIYHKVKDPAVGNIIAYPSRKIGRGSFERFVPGCAAIISETKDNQPSKIIIAHPNVSGIIGETNLDLFQDKSFIFLEVS